MSARRARRPSPTEVVTSAYGFRWPTCNRATGVHIDWAHQGAVDRCLCRAETRPCAGDCGLPDCSWLTLSGQ